MTSAIRNRTMQGLSIAQKQLLPSTRSYHGIANLFKGYDQPIGKLIYENPNFKKSSIVIDAAGTTAFPGGYHGTSSKQLEPYLKEGSFRVKYRFYFANNVKYTINYAVEKAFIDMHRAVEKELPREEKKNYSNIERAIAEGHLQESDVCDPVILELFSNSLPRTNSEMRDEMDKGRFGHCQYFDEGSEILIYKIYSLCKEPPGTSAKDRYYSCQDAFRSL